MKNNLIYPLLYTTFGGILVLLFNYFILMPSKTRPDVEVTQNAVEIDNYSGKLLLKKYLTEAGIKVEENPINNYRLYSRSFLFQTFLIQNLGQDIYRNVSVEVNDFDLVVMQSNDKVVFLNNGIENAIKLNPGTEVQITGISKGSLMEKYSKLISDGKIIVSVDGKIISPQSFIIDGGRDILYLIKLNNEYPWLFSAALLLAIISTGGVIVSIIFGILCELSPNLKASAMSVDNLVDARLAEQHIRKHNPKRYEEFSKALEAKLPTGRFDQDANPT